MGSWQAANKIFNEFLSSLNTVSPILAKANEHFPPKCTIFTNTKAKHMWMIYICDPELNGRQHTGPPELQLSRLYVFHGNKYFVAGTSSVNQKVSSSNLFHSKVCIYLNFPPRLQMFMGEAISISVLDDTSGEAAGSGNFLVSVCTFLYKQVTYFLEA